MSDSSSDCEISVGISRITEVPLLPGETVLEDFQGEGGFCGISCECYLSHCPKEYGRLTNRRIIVLQKGSRVLHSESEVVAAAFLEDVTACAVGRKRPMWWAILSLFIVGVFLVGYCSAAIDNWNTVQSESYACRKKGDCDPAPAGWVIMVVLGLIMMGLAVSIYSARPITITFSVKGSTNSDSGFSLVMASRGLAMEVLGRYFTAKNALMKKKRGGQSLVEASTTTPVGHVLAADPQPAASAFGQRFELVSIRDLHCAHEASLSCSANDSAVVLVTAGLQKCRTTRRQCTVRRDTWMFSPCKATMHQGRDIFALPNIFLA